jgi:hypothetical protein
MKENKGVNRSYNRTTGQRVSKTIFSGDKAQANQWIAPRINGHFTGTTAQILRWAACKWGIDQNMVFAQAQHRRARQDIQSRRRMGLHRPLVRQPLAHPGRRPIRIEGQAVPAREDLDDQELPAA